jgi:hypothetical protein
VPSDQVPGSLKTAIQEAVEDRGEEYAGFCRDINEGPNPSAYAGQWCSFVLALSMDFAQVTFGAVQSNELHWVTFIRDGDVWTTQAPGDGGILFGNPPPASGGFGTFAFGGGTFEQLLEASGCPPATAAFFHNKPDGTFAAWIPGAQVGVVNDEFVALFAATIPEGTIFTVRCV